MLLDIMSYAILYKSGAEKGQHPDNPEDPLPKGGTSSPTEGEWGRMGGGGGREGERRRDEEMKKKKGEVVLGQASRVLVL